MASEIDPKTLKTTQDLLTKIVKKPVITEKLLKRPPFRFLHDLITNIIKTHGFLKDLYEDNELIADNVKEKDTKIAFLQKAIDATGFIIGDVVNVKPSKIVAGLETDKTNEWLQILAKVLIEKKSSSDAVKRVLSGEKPTKRNSTTNSNNSNKKKALNENTKTSNNTNRKTKKETQTETRATNEVKSEQNNQIIKETIDSKEVIDAKESPIDRTSPLLSDNNEEQNSLKQSKQELPENNLQNGNASKPGSASDMSVPQPTVAPTESYTKMDNKDDTNDQIVEKETDQLPNDSTKTNDEIVVEKPAVQRVKTVRPKIRQSAKQTLTSNITKNTVTETNQAVRPPTRQQRTARPSSSRPAPPRVIPKVNEDNKLIEAELEEKLRLLNAKPVENLITENLTNDTNDDDQDFIVTSVIKSEDLESTEHRLEFDGITEQKGSLVKQLVETKKELEGNQSSDVSIDDKKQIRQTNRDIEKLRQTIQSLSQTANPLGKVLDYLQEDIDSMLSELNSWQEEYKRNVQSLEKTRNTTFAGLEPYKQELNILDTNIREQIEKISQTKANIIRNEEKIQKIVQMINKI